MEIENGFSEGYAYLDIPDSEFSKIDFENSTSFVVTNDLYDIEDQSYEESFSNDYEVTSGQIEDEAQFVDECLDGTHEMIDYKVTFYGPIQVKKEDV